MSGNNNNNKNNNNNNNNSNRGVWGKWGKDKDKGQNNANANKGQWSNKGQNAQGTQGWAGYNKTQQTAGFAQNQQREREQVLTPVCTIGLPVPTSTVNLKLKIEGERIPEYEDFAVNHISQMGLFNKYTLDEIRYYDYLHGIEVNRNMTFIDPVTVDSLKKNSFGQYRRNDKNNMNQANINQDPVPINITPWKRKPDDIKQPPASSTKQPFGALPATQINVSQAEGDDVMLNQEPIPDDPGFRDNISRYQHILITNPSKSATPGLRQLNAQKIQIRSTPKESSSKSQSNLHVFTEKLNNYEYNENDDEEIIDNPEYSYIPSLKTIGDNEEVYNFTVIHRKFGSIAFPDGFKVKQINPETKITFSEKQVNVDISNKTKKQLGIDKDFISIVTLNNIFPSESREQESLREYENDLMKFCHDHDLGFISYMYDDGKLMFSVPSLSLFPIRID